MEAGSVGTPVQPTQLSLTDNELKYFKLVSDKGCGNKFILSLILFIVYVIATQDVKKPFLSYIHLWQKLYKMDILTTVKMSL